MISKQKGNAPFILTKLHSILYYGHSYSLNKYADINVDIPEKDFVIAFKNSKNFRITAIKNYLNSNYYISFDTTLSYFEGKGIINNIEKYKNDVANALASHKVINSTNSKIIENLTNMKINNEENVCINVPYTLIESNEIKTYKLFYIITENIRLDLMKIL